MRALLPALLLLAGVALCAARRGSLVESDADADMPPSDFAWSMLSRMKLQAALRSAHDGVSGTGTGSGPGTGCSFTALSMTPSPTMGGTTTITGTSPAASCTITFNYLGAAPQPIAVDYNMSNDVLGTAGVPQGVATTNVSLVSNSTTRYVIHSYRAQTITGVSPTFGIGGTTIVLTGTNFGMAGTSVIVELEHATSPNKNLTNVTLGDAANHTNLTGIVPEGPTAGGVFTIAMNREGSVVRTEADAGHGEHHVLFMYTFATPTVQITMGVNLDLTSNTDVAAFKSGFKQSLVASLNDVSSVDQILISPGYPRAPSRRRLLATSVLMQFRVISTTTGNAEQRSAFSSAQTTAVVAAAADIAAQMGTLLNQIVTVDPTSIVIVSDSGTLVAIPQTTPAPNTTGPVTIVSVGFPAWATFLIVLGSLLVLAGGAVVVFRRRMEMQRLRMGKDLDPNTDPGQELYGQTAAV